MANLDFYRAKAVELRHRLQWIKDALKEVNERHPEIKRWALDLCTQSESKISRMEVILQHGNIAYIPRLKTDHILLERDLFCISDYVGVMLREGHYETRFANVIRRFCRETGFNQSDFLVDFTPIGPAVSTARHGAAPIFYVRDESLASAYTWIGVFHEVGHIGVHSDRRRIIEPLMRIVRDHYGRARTSIGPVDPQTREQLESALNLAERYWTEGSNDTRLEELFCDCFATYACGLAYLYSWLDHGVSFEEKPKFVNLCDDHPPFSARLEACWHIVPESLRTAELATMLKGLWDTYSQISFATSNPDLDYGIACQQDLLHNLAKKSVELIHQHWSALSHWDQEPKATPEKIKGNQPLASILNNLVAVLFRDPTRYRESEERIINLIMGSSGDQSSSGDHSSSSISVSSSSASTALSKVSRSR